jgi:hypothetical protein
MNHNQRGGRVAAPLVHMQGDLSALEAAELYRRRWQIELFFKRSKQNLKIKAFYGTSKTAVTIHILTAMIAYLLLLWLKFKSKTGWGLLQLTRLAQTMLLERLDLWALLCPRPPDNRQPLLFNQRAGKLRSYIIFLDNIVALCFKYTLLNLRYA